jgi:hypothetical protein
MIEIFLKYTRTTIIASTYVDYDLDVYLNNELISQWFGEGSRSHNTFKGILFKDFLKAIFLIYKIKKLV